MTILRATLLGTSAAQPTVRRGLSATAVRAHGDRFLIDCGEGTQRQMLRFGTGFSLDFVLFTHFHADHYLGIVGFLRTLAMGGRTEPLDIYGPGPHVRSLLEPLIHLGIEALSFPVSFRALAHGDRVEREAYAITAVAVDHRTAALGYVLEEPARPGAFDVEKATRSGVPAGPLFGELQRGRDVVVAERVVRSRDVLGAPRPGRKIAFSGDTRPSARFAEAAAGADLVVHESTFADADLERAKETMHSTAREAACVAQDAAAARLVLTHLSSRYDMTPETLLDEARSAFHGESLVAEDGLAIDVLYRDA